MGNVTAYFRLLHPYTSLSVAFTAFLLSLPLNSDYQLTDALIFFLIVLLIQFTIGMSNDVYDRHLDEVTKPWKPLPSEKVDLLITQFLILVTISLAIGLSFRFMIAVQLTLLLGLGTGIVYNLGMKRSLLSWLPLSLALPLLLISARLVNGTFLIVYLWSFPVSLLLGPAINLANQLADGNRSSPTEKSLLFYCGNTKNAGRITALLLVLTALIMPVIAAINSLNLQIIMITSILGLIFTIIFFTSSEGKKWRYLYPIAFLVTITHAFGLLLSLE